MPLFLAFSLFYGESIGRISLKEHPPEKNEFSGKFDWLDTFLVLL